MKFWIDECLTPALISQAHSNGYEATCNRDRGQLGMPDDELLAIAVDEEFVFVTNNHADFIGLRSSAELHTGLIVLPQAAGSHRRTWMSERCSRRLPATSPTCWNQESTATSEEMDSPGNTTAKQRAVAYVRESTEEQGQGFSPDAQREGIRRFAPENDLELVGEYCDFHSGWRKSEARPEFQRLMADAAEGMFDVVLVYHTSRFARNQVEARRYKQLLRERLGIRVVSVTQPMGEDPSDPSAFLAESIHEMFDRAQEVRGWRTRVVKPGRPSEDYLLRKLLRCERCGARMHGTSGSRAGIRR